jgi:hypothetical protein
MAIAISAEAAVAAAAAVAVAMASACFQKLMKVIAELASVMYEMMRYFQEKLARISWCCLHEPF